MSEASARLRVMNPGVLTTVQDRGRIGWQRAGVPRSGAMDRLALEAANRLVGNAPDAAALEITAGGAVFEMLAPTLLAVTGGDLGPLLDDQPLLFWATVLVRPGSRLLFRSRPENGGARSYLALAGGIAVASVLGSRSTYLPGGFGGFGGRPLRAGDVLSVETPPYDSVLLAGRTWPGGARPPYRSEPVLRLLPGPHHDLFEAESWQALITEPYHIGASSNRMGYRLEGSPLRSIEPVSLPSLGVLPGVIQVPPDGLPILLMADAQTTGGYPIIGVVIEPDLSLAAQLLPGDSLRFAPVTIDEALVIRSIWESYRGVPIADETDWTMMRWAGAPSE